MIVVKVELHSAINGSVRELARMEIANDGDLSDRNPNRGDYAVRTLRGRSSLDFTNRVTQRSGFVRSHARFAEHVWNLVAKALKALKYGEKSCNSTSTPVTEPTFSASREATGT